jgi:hypothetical protein
MKINKDEIKAVIYRLTYKVKWYFISLGYSLVGKTGKQLNDLYESMDEMFIRNVQLENEISALEFDLIKSKKKTTSPKKRKS